jgi:hypothetical protein
MVYSCWSGSSSASSASLDIVVTTFLLAATFRYLFGAE